MNTQRIINPVTQVKPFIQRDTYGFVSSQNIVETFSAKGWMPVQTQVSKVRAMEKEGFQKHLIKFEHPEYSEIKGLSTSNASRPQLILLNSHDGSSAFRVLWGLIRFTCLNGLISGTMLRDFKASHSKNVTHRLSDGIEYMLEGLPAMLDQVLKLQNTTFTQDALNEYVKAVVDARLENVKSVTSVNYQDALTVRRSDDKATDAFTVANRVQESIIRGGINYQYESTDVRGFPVVKYATTKRLASIPSQVKMNKLVWDKAVNLTA